MTGAEATRLDVLLCSVATAWFGIDADQIAEAAAYAHATDDGLVWLSRQLGQVPRDGESLAPTVLTLRGEHDQAVRIVVDRMEDILPCRLDDIHPFPALVEPLALRTGMWGLLFHRGRMVVLLDVLRFLNSRSTPS